MAACPIEKHTGAIKKHGRKNYFRIGLAKLANGYHWLLKIKVTLSMLNTPTETTSCVPSPCFKMTADQPPWQQSAPQPSHGNDEERTWHI